MFFANAVNSSGMTFVNNHRLLNKVYFPRAILPVAAVVACLLDWLIGVGLLLVLLLYRGYRPALEWLLIPILGLLTALLAAAVGLAAASLAAMYRDVKHLLPYLIQVWMYATPVWFTRGMVPRKLQ
jgi:lipopolysaccharide transport system permease protein